VEVAKEVTVDSRSQCDVVAPWRSETVKLLQNSFFYQLLSFCVLTLD